MQREGRFPECLPFKLPATCTHSAHSNEKPGSTSSSPHTACSSRRLLRFEPNKYQVIPTEDLKKQTKKHLKAEVQ